MIKQFLSIFLLFVNTPAFGRDIDPVESLYDVGSDSYTGLLEAAPQVRLKLQLIAKTNPISIQYDRLFLGDIFECRGLKSACLRVSATDLGPSPSPGRTTHLLSNKVKKLIEKYIQGGYEFDFDLPPIMYLKADYQEIDRGMLSREIENILEGYNNKSTARLSVDRVSIVRSAKLRPGLINLDLSVFERRLANLVEKLPLKKHVQLSMLNGEVISTNRGFTSADSITFSVKINIEKKVYVAKQNLLRGMSVREDYFYQDWRMVNKMPVQDMQVAIGKKISSRVRRDDYLTFEDLMEPILIDRGDKVNVIIISSGMQLRQKGKALNKAIKGGMVSVRLENNRKVSGVAISKKLVRIN